MKTTIFLMFAIFFMGACRVWDTNKTDSKVELKRGARLTISCEGKVRMERKLSESSGTGETVVIICE